jgi:hypothetical protein
LSPPAGDSIGAFVPQKSAPVVFYSFRWRIKQRNYQLEHYFVQPPLEALLRRFVGLYVGGISGHPVLRNIIACRCSFFGNQTGQVFR